jgi:hypothetical protein
MTPLLAAAGEHGHLELGVTFGPLVLRVAVLAAVPVVAGFALLRGFLAEPGRFTTAAVVATACGVGSLELLLAGGLNLPEQTVPLLLLALGAPLYLALSRDRRFAPAVTLARRLAPWVFWPVAVLAAVQFGTAWFAGGERTAVLLHTGVLLALVALSWFAVSRAGALGLRVGAALVATGLIAGTAQATVLRPAEPVAGVATSAKVAVGSRYVDALVVPNLPGWNLVRVDLPGARAGLDRDRLVAAGRWAAVELPAGRSELWIRDGDDLGSFGTDTGATGVAPEALAGPDGPECASALLGAMVAGGVAGEQAACPSDALRPEDADELARTVELVAARGHDRIAVVADRSPRGVAASAVVGEAAARLGMTVGASGVVLVVSGWVGAETVVRAGGRDAVYLAPWLYAPPVLAVDGGQWVARSFDPDDESFRRYAGELRADYPGQEPSAVGYHAWLGERMERASGPLRLYRVGSPVQ